MQRNQYLRYFGKPQVQGRVDPTTTLTRCIHHQILPLRLHLQLLEKRYVAIVAPSGHAQYGQELSKTALVPARPEESCQLLNDRIQQWRALVSTRIITSEPKQGSSCQGQNWPTTPLSNSNPAVISTHDATRLQRQAQAITEMERLETR
jgi:hypothetical protein